MGAIAGLGGATWHWAVEIAQVNAGLVHYPPETLAAGVQAHVWSVIHQCVAIAMRLGATEFMCSLGLSVLIGALSMQALALTVNVFARNAWHSVACSVVVILVRASSYGVTYPVELLPTAHTYGVVGLSLGIVTVALTASGFLRVGAFLAGAGIAVHPAIGTWVAIALTAIVSVRHRRDSQLRRAAPWLAIGLTVSVVSLFFHLAMRPPTIGGDLTVAARYVEGLILNWDMHRQPVRWSAAGVAFNFMLLFLAVAVLPRLSINGRVVMSFAALTAAFALGMAALTALPLAWQPRWFLVSIPGRWLNFGAVLLAPVLLGLLARRDLAPARFLTPTALLWLLVIADPHGLLSPLITGDNRAISSQSGILLVVGAIVLVTAVSGVRRPPPVQTYRRASAWIAFPAALVCVCGGLNLLRFGHLGEADRFDGLWKHRADAVVFEAASGGQGLLVTPSDLWLVQLRTRRPVLLDCPLLDTLAYAPEASPFAEAVLSSVYGASLLRRPSAEAVEQFSRPAQQAVWARLSRADWQAIRQRYGVTNVLAYREWVLDLPTVATGETLVLKRIPY